MTLALKKVRIRESGRSVPNLNIYEDRNHSFHALLCASAEERRLGTK